MDSSTRKLASAERTALESLLQAKPLYARRARLLLAWDAGLPLAEIAEQTPLSPARVRYWLARFVSLRLRVFPVKVLASVPASNEALRFAQGDAGEVTVSEAKPAPTANETPRPVQGDAGEVMVSEAKPAPTANEPLRSAQGDNTINPAPRPTKPGISQSDPMAEAGRKILRLHFLRMLEQEAGTRAGDDIEHLHDMRVATRRLRAAFVLFSSYYTPEATNAHIKDLRRIGRALGAVRDLDVFLQKAQAYLATLPTSEQTSLDPLLTSWRAKREEARRRMLATLDSPRYQGFCRAFDLFTSTPGMGAKRDDSAPPTPILLAHVAPMLVHQRLAEVRAFEPLLPSAPVTVLHQLRIACKRLRYTLEFFEETLGTEAKEVIKEIVAMQDHLGNLQDAVVATDLLRGFLNEWAERQKNDGAAQQVDIHGVTQYLAMKQAETLKLLRTFQAAWQRFNDPRLRDKLARALSTL